MDPLTLLYPIPLTRSKGLLNPLPQVELPLEEDRQRKEGEEYLDQGDHEFI